MLLVLVYLLLSVMVAVYARNLGRPLLGYFLLALVATPFLAFIALLLIGPAPPPEG